MTGVPPSGSGSRASHEAATASSPKASIPNAAREDCDICGARPIRVIVEGRALCEEHRAEWLGEECAAADVELERREKKKERWLQHKQFFIVFSPDGQTPPAVVHQTHKAALFTAHEMARKHPGQTFFVMGSVSRPCVAASAIEARSDATGTGAAEGESAAPQEDANA